MSEHVSKGGLRRTLRCLRGRIFLLLFSLLSGGAASILMLLVPVFVGNAIDRMIGVGQVDFVSLRSCLWKIAWTVAAAAFLQWLMALCNQRISYVMVRDLRKQAFEKLNGASVAYLDSHPHGDLVSRITSDADQLADGLLMGLTQLFSGAVTILGTLFLMIRMEYRIALVMLLITPLSLLAAKFISGRTYRFFKAQTKERGQFTAYVSEMLDGEKTVRAMNYETQAEERFDTLNESLRRTTLKATFFSSLTNPVTRFVNSIAYAGVTFAGALTALSNPAFTVGTLSCMLSYASQYTKPFNEITGVITEMQGAIACADRIFALLDLEAESMEQDAPEARPMPRPAGAGAACAVEFRHVCFSYTPDRPLIEDFSLRVAPGMQVAIVGPTGCGKTTLINLLLRFYEPQSGQILIDGEDVGHFTKKSLRAACGMVLQDTWIRSGTVRENIALGRPDASDEEIVQAAKAARAHRFILRLPHGYDTRLGEDGVLIGEGQKQLLSIARIMLLDPSILILDEATSSIDLPTELRIQDAFGELLHGRTGFIVAHRLKTVQKADLILVMRDGHVVEQGTHRELLSQRGFYASLYESQFLCGMESGDA